MTIEFEGKYFCAEVVERKAKTEVYSLMSRHGDGLGWVKWYAPWRQYCFFPHSDTVWSKSCLEDVNQFIQQLMRERRQHDH